MDFWIKKHIDKFQRILELNIGVSQSDNEELFSILSSIRQLRLHRFESGDEYNGWVVPYDWKIKHAHFSKNGKIIFDGSKHPMAVVGSSPSFAGKLSLEELKTHLFSSSSCPDAYPFHCMNNYRPWAKEWGFCIPDKIYNNLEDGIYQVDIKTDFLASQMIVGEDYLPGDSDETIVFNAHTCHPCQFEDGFSGVALIMELFDWLEKKSYRRYSYKAIFAPEHLGTVFYLRDLPLIARKQMKFAIFVEMIGLESSFAVQKSFTGNHLVDLTMSKLALEMDPQTRIGKFRTILGNDETVWEAPGIEIPCLSLSRCSNSPFYFKEYHTSEDTIEKSNLKQRLQSINLLKNFINAIETDYIPKRNFEGIIALSNPKYNLYTERPDPTVKKDLNQKQIDLGKLQDRIPRYLNGEKSILELSIDLNIDFKILYNYLNGYHEKELVKSESVKTLEWYKRR
jgi:aminopeptidase-like protein